MLDDPVKLSPELVRTLDDPAHRGEVRLGKTGPQDLGLRLYAPDLEGLRELVGRLALPARLTELAQEIEARFELVPGHWVRLGTAAGRPHRFALNYEVPPWNVYPISTLRVFLRRYGASPSGLERALAPALELEDARWGVTLEVKDELRPRFFGRFPRTLLEPIAVALVGAEARATIEECSGRGGSSWCYLSLEPGRPGSLGVDLENLPLAELGLPLDTWPALPEPLVCPYAKCRGAEWSAYLSWFAFSAWWRPPHSLATESMKDYQGRVRTYYETQQPAYLESLGTTWQAGLLSDEGAQASNLELAQRARLEPGLRILDAGCGVAGPALDMARAFPGLEVEGITLCPSQVEEARRRVADAGLGGHVRVQQADFHDLPFPDASFHRVLYLESSGYAYDRVAMFGEAHRVLEPGGLVYLKDVFRLAGPLSPSQWRELASFDHLYAQRTPTLEETLASLEQAGLHPIEVARLDVSMDHYHRALRSTAFGQAHRRVFRDLPLYFAEVLARRE
jgi:ubiquinone/menaquinone biosynthesis C-methylase UbiE